ncbi:MAG: hypothetical protein JRH18_15060 [Deltaproteobacteria bacterium]|nr:hypothetical protein [Deltaproteobacteria bacterium]MBW1962132.1 hypothetical protein [Deltaproteobacteria bacterium]MBW1996285.1 hypothetical protein [Deltaproteobacteria bacterium]MBW2152976.1 hypothetical protein [Deltaproteobacteria bacterium]
MTHGKPKGVIRRFVTRTLRGEALGFEAYMWAAQRVSGVIILGFLIWHLYTLGSVLSGAEAFDQAMKRMQSTVVRLGELVFVWIVLLHALNGLRLIMLNLFPALNHKRLAYCVSLLSIVLILFSIPMIF